MTPTDAARLAKILKAAYIAAYAQTRDTDPDGWYEVLAQGKGGAWLKIAEELIKRGVLPPEE